MPREMTQYYKDKLEQGLYFQDFVVEELYKCGLPIISYSSKEYQNMIGENKAGIEIKNDSQWKDTGNLYIEIAEKSNAENKYFVPSGIYRNDNTWLYLIGDKSKIFIFGKKFLVLLHKTGKYKEIPIKAGTSVGFLVPVKEAEEKYAIKIIEPEINNKIQEQAA